MTCAGAQRGIDPVLHKYQLSLLRVTARIASGTAGL
jgi:hypothetical protein